MLAMAYEEPMHKEHHRRHKRRPERPGSRKSHRDYPTTTHPADPPSRPLGSTYASTWTSSRGPHPPSPPLSARHEKSRSLSERVLAPLRRVLSASPDRQRVRVLSRVMDFTKRALRQTGGGQSQLLSHGTLSGELVLPSAPALPHDNGVTAREFLTYHVRPKENGTWQATVRSHLTRYGLVVRSFTGLK
jgi:hypothetical protein